MKKTLEDYWKLIEAQLDGAEPFALERQIFFIGVDVALEAWKGMATDAQLGTIADMQRKCEAVYNEWPEFVRR